LKQFLHDAGERVLLNQVEQLLFALEIVVQAGERKATGAAQIANGSSLEPIVCKDVSGMMENVLKFSVEACAARATNTSAPRTGMTSPGAAE
jgi:hypothetical protein